MIYFRRVAPAQGHGLRNLARDVRHNSITTLHTISPSGYYGLCSHCLTGRTATAARKTLGLGVMPGLIVHAAAKLQLRGWCCGLVPSACCVFYFFCRKIVRWSSPVRLICTQIEIQDLLASCSIPCVETAVAFHQREWNAVQQGDPSRRGLGLTAYHGSWAEGTDQT